MRISASYWWSTASLLQMAFMMVCLNAKQCTRTGSSFMVLGVFDGNDTASILNFRKAIEVLDNLVAKEPRCTPKVTHRELTLHDQMSALEVINATRNVFLGEKICYVVYSSYGRNGQLLLDYAIKNRIPVVSTIPKKEYTAWDDHGSHYFDPAKVINLNVRSTRSTKVQVIVDFLFQENHKEFVAITGADVEDMSVVSSLHEAIKERSLVMVDWFIVPRNSAFTSRAKKLKHLQSHVTILIITNDMQLAKYIVIAAYKVNLHCVLASDIIEGTDFPVRLHVINPEVRKVFTKTEYVEDAIGMLRVSLKEWIIIPSGICPSIREIQSHLPKVAFSGKTGSVKFNDERQRVHDRYEISNRYPEESFPKRTELVSNFHDGFLKKNIGGSAQGVRIVKMATVEYAPYIMIHPKISPDESCESKNALPCFKKVPDGVGTMHESCCNGFVIDVIRTPLVRDRLCSGAWECDIKLIFNDDGMYGIRDKNGSWNGVVNDVTTEQVDMSADLFPNSRRSEVLDFTDVYMPTGIALLVKESKRQQSKIHWTSYMRPFTSTLWFVFAGSVGVMIAFLWIVEKFAPSRTDGKLFDWRTAFRLDNAVCYVLQLAFGRPADDKKPMLNGARLTGLMFGIAMMILMASYSANLAAFLIVSDLTTPVDSIYDKKIENPPPGFKYGTLEGSYMADFFSSTDIEYFSKIWPNMKKDSVKSLSEGVKKVSSGKLDVFIGDSVGLEYAALDDPHCNLKVVSEPFAMSGPSFAVKKGSSLLAPLATAIRELQAKGLRTFIQKSWVKKFKCQKEVLPAQLPLIDLSGLFLQLLIVIILCILGTSCHLGWNRILLEYRKCQNKEMEKIDENVEINTCIEFQTHKETNI